VLYLWWPSLLNCKVIAVTITLFFNSFLNIDGIGEIQISSIKKFFSIKENFNVVKDLSKLLEIQNEAINKSGKLKNYSFMITGKLENMSRAEV